MDVTLEDAAKRLRRDVLSLVYERKEGHIGGSLSIVEILISLYERILKKEDKFILSKGHAYPPLYLMLKSKGYNPKLSGHPDIDPENGVFCTTGSLGHGFPIAVGMALARKIKKQEGNIYVIIGDAECQEGTIWESSLIAAHHKLDNLILIVDNNKVQTLGKTEDILSVENLEKKFESFDFDVSRVDGHSFAELIPALTKKVIDKPRVIIAETIKGKGVSFMEGVSKWHSFIPSQEELNLAHEELK